MSGLKAAMFTAHGAAEDLRHKAFLVTTYLENDPPWLRRIIANAEQAVGELEFVLEQMKRGEGNDPFGFEKAINWGVGEA